jgi:hypothetical protein
MNIGQRDNEGIQPLYARFAEFVYELLLDIRYGRWVGVACGSEVSSCLANQERQERMRNMTCELV